MGFLITLVKDSNRWDGFIRLKTQNSKISKNWQAILQSVFGKSAINVGRFFKLKS
jgi:hypothetical protein